MKLVIAEKPSVALTIAKVIGANQKKSGYYEGNGYQVSWCIGHLVQMVNPEAYDEKYRTWNIEDLPIIPQEYQYDIVPSTKKQFLILKKLMNAKETETVVNACDAGREGEAIFRLVYYKARCRKKIERLWISSMEDRAIQEGFEQLQDGRAYDPLFESAQARAIADWLVGMNMSRLYSCLYRQNYSVGRVQTPTLAMIVERDQAIENHVKKPYWIVNIQSNSLSLSTGPIENKAIAQQLYHLLPDHITIAEVKEEEKITKPEPLYDLTTLQRECNKYFGYSAKQTLDYAQSLYEKKWITYPRTDSRYLTEDMIVPMVNEILGKNDFDTERIKVIFNSKKVTDHHAIIPTRSSMKADVAQLPFSEAKVYELIVNKCHAAFGFPFIECVQKVRAEFDGFSFTHTEKSMKEEGFTRYLKAYQKEKEPQSQVIPSFKVGDAFFIEKKKVEEKYTAPPKHYTEDTLLKAMERAGSDALEKGVEVERKGLGTPATRAGIIEHLILKGYVERDKKNLIATRKGFSLVTIVADPFKSAETTAQWEMELSDIAQGKSSKKKFLNNIESKIKETVLTYRK